MDKSAFLALKSQSTWRLVADIWGQCKNSPWPIITLTPNISDGDYADEVHGIYRQLVEQYSVHYGVENFDDLDPHGAESGKEPIPSEEGEQSC